MVRTLLGRRRSSSRRCWATALPCSFCWPLVPAPTSDRCLDGSTCARGRLLGPQPGDAAHAAGGGDLRLHDPQGRTPREWAEQGGAKQSWEPLQLCRAHTSALVHGSELAPTAPPGQLQASSGQSLCGGVRLMQADRARRPEQIRRTPQIPAVGFGQVSGRSEQLVERLPARGEPDRTYESSSHTLMANLLWRGHPVPVTVWQLKAPGAQPDVLLPDLQHCRYVTAAFPPVACSPPAQSPAPPQPVAADGTEPLGRPVGAVPSLRTRVAGTKRGGPCPVPACCLATCRCRCWRPCCSCRPAGMLLEASAPMLCS
uniref:Uncharacterized protein n=1 Tax=Phocoena sinus TaxID=42100 RepID=A0A8C9KZH6_PHOSS